MQFLNISTNLVVSSSIPIDNQLKSYEKVMAICNQRGADIYINPIGGLELYNKPVFKEKNLELQFHKSNNISYNQYDNDFIPSLSIIDVMMFNNKIKLTTMLNNYSII
jgi:hypothetical protein